MAGKSGTKRGVRLTISNDTTMIDKSRLVQEAMTRRRREAFRREIERFCTAPDASDLEDVRRALPAQREALDRK